MPINLQRSIEIERASEEVWEFFVDPHRVIGCLPGAKLIEAIDERTFRGEIEIRMGPFGACFLGTITFDELDRENLRVTLSGHGTDERRQGTVTMRMRSRLEAREGGRTSVLVDQMIDLKGGIGSLGSGLLKGVAELMFGRFTGCVKQTIESPPR